MEFFQAVWLSLNIVFGLWTFRNISVKIYATATGNHYRQNQLGSFLDLFVISSLIAYYLIY